MDCPSPKRPRAEFESKSGDKDRISCLPEEILKLEFSLLLCETVWTRQLPKLTSVKQLELRVDGFGDASLFPLTRVIEACPYLRSFVLELTNPMDMLCRQRELIRVVRPPHRIHYLKDNT
ncbi:hypothetical protein NL676_017716 [Syzygium grande]|nr:hypothetical protein NL676_017716 [Syzygium grande]